MRTLFLTCTLGLFLSAFVSAQTFEQLQSTIETHIQTIAPTEARLAEILASLKRTPASPETVDASRAIIAATTQIHALPNLADEHRRWTLQREAIALIILAYAEPVTYYPRLVRMSDELADRGLGLARLAEEHALEIGGILATQTRVNAVNINWQSLAERMVLHAQQYPGAASIQIIENFLQRIRQMNPLNRDLRLKVVAPIFQSYYYQNNMTQRALALDTDIMRSTLEGTPMILRGGVDINGRDFDVSTIQDRVVLLYFWATWCVPCKERIPELIRLHEQYYATGLRIIGINMGGGVDNDRHVRHFLENERFDGNRIPWINLHEGLAEQRNRERGIDTISKTYGIADLPMPVMILIGRNGRVVRLHPLPATLPDLIAYETSIFATVEFTEEELRQRDEAIRRQQLEEAERVLRPASPGL